MLSKFIASLVAAALLFGLPGPAAWAGANDVLRSEPGARVDVMGVPVNLSEQPVLPQTDLVNTSLPEIKSDLRVETRPEEPSEAEADKAKTPRAKLDQAYRLTTGNSKDESLAPSAWNRFWHGGDAQTTGEPVAAEASNSKTLKSLAPAALAANALMLSPKVAAHIPAAAVSVIKTGGAAAAAWTVTRIARAVISRVAIRRGWSENQEQDVNTIVQSVAWSAAALVSAHFLLGLSLPAVMKAYPFVSLAAGSLVNSQVSNFLKGATESLLWPLAVGDRVNVENTPLEIKKFTATRVEMAPIGPIDASDGSPGEAVTKPQYTEFLQAPITVEKDYVPPGTADAGDSARQPIGSILKGNGYWISAALASAVAGYFFTAVHGSSILGPAFAALATLIVAKHISKLASAIARLFNFDKKSATVVAKAAVGLSVILGVHSVMAALGASAATVALSVGGIVSFFFPTINAYIDLVLRRFMARRQYRIGDRIKIEKWTGTIRDITLEYIALTPDGTRQTVLLPHVYLKGKQLPPFQLPPLKKD